MSTFLKNVSVILLAQIITFLSSIASNILTARVLGPEGKGVLAIAMLIFSIIARFSSLSIEISNVYFIGQRRYKVADIAGNSIFLGIIISIIIGAIYFPLLPDFAKLLSKDIDIKFLAAAFLVIPLSLISSYLSSVLLGMQRIKELSMINISTALIRFVFLLLFIVILDLGVVGALIAIILISTCRLILNIILLRRYTQFKIAKDKRLIEESIRFGLKGHIGNVLQFFNYRLDVFLVNFFLGARSVGIYATSVTLAELLWYIPSSVQTVLLSKTASSDSETARRFTPIVCRHTLFITTLAAILLALIGKPLILVAFTDKFAGAVQPLYLLLIGIIALSLSKVITSDLAGRGMPYYMTYAVLISLVSTVIFDIALIPRIGIAGAAIASSVAYCITTAVVVAFYIGNTGVKLSDILILRKDDIKMYLSFWREKLYPRLRHYFNICFL